MNIAETIFNLVYIYLIPAFPAIVILLYKIGIFRHWAIPIKYIKVSDFVSAAAIGASFVLLTNKDMTLAWVIIALIILFVLFILHESGSKGNPFNFKYMDTLLGKYKISWFCFALTILSLIIYKTTNHLLIEYISFISIFVSICFLSFFIGFEFPKITPYLTIANNQYIVISDYGNSFIAIEIDQFDAIDHEKNFYNEITYNKAIIAFIPIAGSTLRKVNLNSLKSVHTPK